MEQKENSFVKYTFFFSDLFSSLSRLLFFMYVYVEGNEDVEYSIDLRHCVYSYKGNGRMAT